ncbi:glutathione S-transferase family protein [Sphingomonas sp. 28-63-12]|uniref:glutathione S-transferase family protein n=1 Tax=Sphingomonas sp. 28-63-12 TaxID=1970434 RepID=UPI000BC93B6B|nr:MAG: glutathione S-transferase [Sphingomonas sp. 28-63-12]
MKLYDSPWAPSPRRVRVYLAEKNIEIERITIDLRQGEQLSPAYLAINPRGVVPALLLDDGEVICESTAICRYFEALQPEPPLFGTDPRSIARIEAWTRRIESDGYAAAVYAFRNGKPQMEGRALPGNWPPTAIIPDLVERAAIMWRSFVNALEAQLSVSPWIAGDSLSFADITALITIDFAERAGLTISDGNNTLKNWHETMSARPSAKA